MSESPVDAAKSYAETRARCAAAQARASEVLSRASMALKIAEERLKRARAAQAAAVNAQQRWLQDDAFEYAVLQADAEAGTDAAATTDENAVATGATPGETPGS